MFRIRKAAITGKPTAVRESFRPGRFLRHLVETGTIRPPFFFLLESGDISRLHRIRSDEIWHFYGGGPLKLVMIAPDGKTAEIVLGPNIEAGEHVQYVVPAGVWFGATPKRGSAFSFVGCTVSPGFDFADFEMGDKNTLKVVFPDAVACIGEFG